MIKKLKITARVAEKKKEKLEIKTEFIKLDAALKLAGAVQTGGQAKAVISDGEVKVNGEKCELRGKKLHEGDSFEYEKIVYEIIRGK